ncbi:MAG: SAM-dependent methyltransferase [Alphaproteobacteria bacterium]|nr:MAG: SAM-dependent methyltransferase [Alphaproteobacteria bacterium]
MADAHQTPLAAYLHAYIGRDQTISFQEYMQICLTHEKHGYYKTAIAVGDDFITAPEISPLFGQVMGFWVLQQWLALKSPPQWTLIELGGGRGTLMRDVLHVLSLVPACIAGVMIQMVECNPHAIAQQRSAVTDVPAQKKNFFPTWVPSSEDLQLKAPYILIANEFLDALPVQPYYMCRGQLWEERVMSDGHSFRCVRAPQPIQEPLPWYVLGDGASLCEGDCIEVCAYYDSFLRSLSACCVEGAAAFIDYGYTGIQRTGTVQGVRQHAYTDVMTDPGFVDITSHVNFTAFTSLAEAQGFSTHVTHQRHFLKDNGIDLRLAKILQQNPKQSSEIMAGYDRLITDLGILFKVAVLKKNRVV